MANTRTSAKRAHQALHRQARNQTNHSAAKSALRDALETIRNNVDLEKAKAAYQNAVKTLSKAASKGTIPRGRASRKISRLTLLAKKINAAILPSVK